MNHNKKLTSRAQELRRNMTLEERKLWYEFLRKYPIQFRRQVTFGNYIADFYCNEAKLVIELDCSQHYSEQGLAKDAIRTERMVGRNLIVLRIPNNEIDKNFIGVCEYIDLAVKTAMMH